MELNITEIYTLIIGSAIIFTTFLFLLVQYINKKQKWLVDEFNILKVRAQHIRTEDEFYAVWKDAKKWNNHCWHRSHELMTVELKTILDMKFKHVTKP